MSLLKQYGWKDYFSSQPTSDDEHFEPGRIAEVHLNRYEIFSDKGKITGELSGRFTYLAAGRADYPVTGDWVLFRKQDNGPAIIEKVLERESYISRNSPGTRIDEQILVANIDTAAVVMGMDNNFNPRRAERYIAALERTGIEVVIILTKSDIAEDAAGRVDLLRKRIPSKKVMCTSVKEGTGTDELRSFFSAKKTFVLLGSSGAGKSTLINFLAGEDLQRINEVRENDSRGRHTTVSREMILLPGGGLVIDTPGLRELQLLSSPDSITDSFDEISELAVKCRFKDCSHTVEKGCAVLEALEKGSLDGDRYRNFIKMRKEAEYLAARANDSPDLKNSKKRWKEIHKSMRKSPKKRN